MNVHMKKMNDIKESNMMNARSVPNGDDSKNVGKALKRRKDDIRRAHNF